MPTCPNCATPLNTIRQREGWVCAVVVLEKKRSRSGERLTNPIIQLRPSAKTRSSVS